MEELEIQSFNFCTVDGLNPISLNAIETKKGNFIIVTYTVAADVNNPLTYNDYLMLIDLNGNIYSKTLMSPSLIDSSNNNNTWIPQQSFIYPNANNKQGFLYFAPLSSGYDDVNFNYNLTQWIINEDGSFSNIAATVLTLQVQPSVVSTVDGGYMFIYPNVTTSQDPYSSQTGLYAMYCGYGSNIVRETVILYENMMYLNIVGLNCFISYSEVGQICLISIQSTTDPNPIIVNIQVSYLSRGTVFDIKHVNVTLPTIINDPNFTPLPFGGYLYSVIQTTNMSSYIWGYVLDENGNLNQWDLSYPTLSDSNFPHQILTNNTLVILQPIVGQNWSLITTDLYKIHEDNGYGNMFIRDTSPTIQQTITARETNPLKITYTIPIVFSIGTITIFQSNGSSNPGIVRQTINGLNNQNYVTFDNDTVSIDIIESTFNNPDSTYYVMIENNFVSTLSYNEPLPGLYSNIWSFTTLPEEEKEKGSSKIKMFFDGIYGKVRLTKDGTSYFDTLNSNQINKFFNNLTQELADAVAVTSKRIITNYRFVIDTNIESSSKQYLLSIKIDKPQSASDRETKLITKDLDIMIRNMDITVLASGSSSKYLEPIYGYVTIRYAVYIILNELVSKENSEDSVQLLDEPGEKDDPEDLNDQQDGSQGQQDKAKEKVTIKKWLEDSKDHKIVLVMLISLAGTDVGVLEIFKFNFQFCRYKFNVKLSKKFERKIIIGETIGIIIKNMPDLAFRVYFLSKAIDFSYLSILTPLVSLIKILSLFTNFTKLMKTRNYGS
ncbi:hypothetical protein GLOIN_2v1886197 [Rhizophagus irregularis DAOM 181602=DAOM 197198]|nr:hypothetical protein GLOIN_2v1886197 [Rhizophagus irregularis DAOM 181602=DAOM 197198]